MNYVEAMKQALEALKFGLHVGFDESSESQIKKSGKAFDQHNKAITALRERLAHCDRCGKKLGGEGDIHTCTPDPIGDAQDRLIAEIAAQPEPMRLYVEDFARRCGWKKDSGEGAFEYVQRKSYAQGLEDATPPAAQQQCNWPTCQSEEYQQALAEQINQELVIGAAQPALVVAAQKVMEEFGTASDSLQELYQTLKLYTTQPAAQPEREPVTVAIEHCLSARNERTPCPHTVSTPSAVMADLKWAVTELEALDDATVQFVLDVLRKHLVAGSFTPAQPAQPEIAPDYWLGYGLQAHTEKPFEGATPVWTSPPAQRQPLTDDPLQGAVDWLLQADGEYFCTALVQRTLRIGYNRAKRLYDTAKERAEAAHGIKE
jgi:DNA segregation ATPase FtsK/SpoIIIE-like protein